MQEPQRSVWFLAGNGGMDIGDDYWGLYSDYYRDPVPHSRLRIRQKLQMLGQKCRAAKMSGKTGVYGAWFLTDMATKAQDILLMASGALPRARGLRSSGLTDHLQISSRLRVCRVQGNSSPDYSYSH